MREILFRGKCLGRLHKKGFVYGSLGVIDTDLVAIYQYKEFAKQLNNKGRLPHEINDDYAVGLEAIDNLLKELVGDSNA